MNKKYCLIPDEEKFYSFLASMTFSSVELMQLKLMHINQICVDESACQWEVHFSCAAHLTGGLLQKAAQQLAAAFSLQSVDMICDGDGSKCQVMQREPQAEVEITDCTGEPLPEEIPLPPEPPDIEIGETLPPEPPCEVSYNNPEEDPEYLQAMAALYGEKKADGQLWGKKIKGTPRKLDTVTEEERNVVIEGTFVKSLDKDGALQTFIDKETRVGSIVLTFNVSDDTGGIFVKLRFDKRDGGDPRKECNEFKNLLKPGMRLRLQGDVAPDRFAFDEMCMVPRGIMKLDAKEERMDNAEVKRVELHCHTKMSKLDGLTPMEGLVKQAIRWGHKALAITDHGVVQAFPFCFDAAEGSDLKLIFGMEGYLISDRQTKDDAVDTENPDAATKGKSKISSHHIIILAKNEIGLRNLYQLVTISHLRYLNKRPLLPRAVIEEHREGLVLGSACEAGELYRAVRLGASDEELEEIAGFYDYL